jgi:hypothetical protein
MPESQVCVDRWRHGSKMDIGAVERQSPEAIIRPRRV